MVTELRITFQRDPHDDRVTFCLTSPGCDPTHPTPLAFILTEKDHEDLRWYLEDYMDLPDGGARKRAQRVEGQLEKWGRGLYDSLFEDGDHRELLNDLIAGETPRRLVIDTADPDILRLPWELLRDSSGPLFRRGITIRRQLETPRTKTEYATSLPLRILLVVSSPEDAGLIDPRSTTRGVVEALEELGGNVDLGFCMPATLSRMNEMLADARKRKKPYHIVHFDGHGTFIPEIGMGGLCFEKHEPEVDRYLKDLVPANRLGDLLANEKIPLVILEACRSGQVSRLPVSGSVAPCLLEAGVGSVIAMSHSVHVEATKILLAQFYRELAKGAPVGAALDQARNALIANPHRWLKLGPDAPAISLQDWFLPQLYQGGKDPVLVPKGRRRKAPKAATAAPPPADRKLEGFPHPPRYGFQGRAWELHALERAFLSHRGVLLHGMGGMGKTALATEAARWWQRTGRYPDGAILLTFEQGGGAERVVQAVGTYLGGDDFARLPAEEQQAEAKRLFEERQVLIVWDNFESVLPKFNRDDALYTEDDYRRIIALFLDWTDDPKGKGRILITCRPDEAGLDGAKAVELKGLLRPNALWLAAAIFDQRGIDWRQKKGEWREGLERLLELLDHHPLSCELVLPHCKKKTPDRIAADFATLLPEFAGEAVVERNRSLLASLEFSKKHLSKEARAILPWLGWFRGGVLEPLLLQVSGTDPKEWAAACAELEETALVRGEAISDELTFFRFHPTLALTADRRAVPDPEEAEKRCIDIYVGLMQAVKKSFHGASPESVMWLMSLEEPNVRRALDLALKYKDSTVASYIGDTLRDFLQRAGRLRERDALVKRLAEEVRGGGFTGAVASAEISEAWSILTQGNPEEAIYRLEDLIARLEATTEFDTAYPLAGAQSYLGRVFCSAGQSRRAIPVLEEAVKKWEGLGEERMGNLAASHGDLAIALGDVGRLDEALAEAEEGLAIFREIGDRRGICSSLGRTADILAAQHRYDEADALYEEALDEARKMGDRGLEGALLQHQGGLAAERSDLDRAAKLHREAMRRFQEMGDEEAVMLTCNSLGVVELRAGRLPEARAWYEKAGKIARSRGADLSGATADLNLGIIWQHEGEQARKAGNEPLAQEHFRAAIDAISESLSVKQRLEDLTGQAESHNQLGQVYFHLRNLDRAEHHAQRSCEIREGLDSLEVWRDYHVLAQIAEARGEAGEARKWQEQLDAIRAEIETREGGGGTDLG